MEEVDKPTIWFVVLQLPLWYLALFVNFNWILSLISYYTAVGAIHGNTWGDSK